MIQILIYLAMAAAAAFALHTAWSGFKDHIAAPYVAAQIAKDQPQIDAANANAKAADLERDHAKADTASCVAAAKDQSDAIDKERLRADNAQKASAAIVAAAKRDAAAHDAEFRRLAVIAQAKPKTDQSCDEARAKSDATLRPVLKDRQGVTK